MSSAIVTLALVNPTAESRRPARLAPRSKTLSGTIALVNGMAIPDKDWGPGLLDGAESLLQGLPGEHQFVRSIRERSLPTDIWLDEVRGCAAVVIAAGDCGSCCLRTGRDQAALELMGIPSVSIVPQDIAPAIREMGRVAGMADIQVLEVARPLLGPSRPVVAGYVTEELAVSLTAALLA
ncbi:MAG: hypothetical protein JOZ39_08010 [Chloroflexi bacterium]|nr:hypothetical protein [Chloroflexota bacterium]